jgi:Na+/H+-dicarboxylate symporter
MRFFKISLAFQMAIATVLGILCGLFFGDYCQVFAPYTSAYIMLLKITAVPYLIGAIMHGVGQLSITQAKMILKKGIMFIGLAWLINITMIYLTYFAFPVPKTTQLGGYVSGNIPPINFAELLIPDNIFNDLTNNIIPAIVIFSLLIGIALMHLKEKTTIMSSLHSMVDVLTRITAWIARITPFGTFIIIAYQAGTIQFSMIKQVSTYIILYILCISIIVFWIFPRFTSMLTHIPSYKWLQQLFPILLLAYTTNVVIVCLPYIIELLRKETLAIDPFDEKAQNQILVHYNLRFLCLSFLQYSPFTP